MGWVKRRIDEHVCAKPGYHKDISVGDIWQCDICKVQWRVVNVNRGQYDQRDNAYFGQKVEYAFENKPLLPPSYDPGVTSWRNR